MNKKNCTVKILTYNIFCRPPFIVNNRTFNDSKWARLKDIIDIVIEEYDIICFQEMFGTLSFKRSWLIKEAKKKGFKYSAYSGNYLNDTKKYKNNKCWTPKVDGGLLTISKYPFDEDINVKELIFSDSSGIDSLSNKGVIFTRIKISNNKTIDLYNTHFQSQDGCLFHQIRMSQASELSLFMNYNSTGPNSHTVVLTGDLNVDANSLYYQDLISNLTKYFTNTLYDTLSYIDKNNRITAGDIKNDNCTITDPDFSSTFKSIDYIFIYNNNKFNLDYKHSARILKFGSEKFVNLSDHYAVSYEIDFAPDNIIIEI